MQPQDDGGIRVLNQPRPVQVLATPAGMPRLFARRSRDAIQRRDFVIERDIGCNDSVFEDLVNGQTFE